MYKIFMTFLAFGVLLHAEMVAGVAVVVKDRAITLYDIQKEMDELNVGREQAVSMLIRKKLEEAEIQERKIKVTTTEVYDEIKETAKRNSMSVGDLYASALNSSGITSSEFKKKVRQKLLSQKLYDAIAFSKTTQPTEDEIKEFYELHKQEFSHPQVFKVVLYRSQDQNELQTKIANPMFYSPSVQTTEQNLEYARISPQLAQLLEQTPEYGFSPIVPDGQGGFMSFYVKEFVGGKDADFEQLKRQIMNAMFTQQREQVLGDYFARLQDNADIHYLRD